MEVWDMKGYVLLSTPQKKKFKPDIMLQLHLRAET